MITIVPGDETVYTVDGGITYIPGTLAEIVTRLFTRCRLCGQAIEIPERTD